MTNQPQDKYIAKNRELKHVTLQEARDNLLKKREEIVAILEKRKEQRQIK